MDSANHERVAGVQLLAGSALVLALVTMAAGFIPALRASRIHPMQALRYE